MNEYYLELHMDEVSRAEKKCPKCRHCGQTIWEERAYEIDGKIYCEECTLARRVDADACDCCGIESEDLYEINGDIYCRDCLDDTFLKYLT